MYSIGVSIVCLTVDSFTHTDHCLLDNEVGCKSEGNDISDKTSKIRSDESTDDGNDMERSESEEKTTKVAHGDRIEMLLEHGAKVDLPNNLNAL